MDIDTHVKDTSRSDAGRRRQAERRGALAAYGEKLPTHIRRASSRDDSEIACSAMDAICMSALPTGVPSASSSARSAPSSVAAFASNGVAPEGWRSPSARCVPAPPRPSVNTMSPIRDFPQRDARDGLLIWRHRGQVPEERGRGRASHDAPHPRPVATSGPHRAVTARTPLTSRAKLVGDPGADRPTRVFQGDPLAPEHRAGRRVRGSELPPPLAVAGRESWSAGRPVAGGSASRRPSRLREPAHHGSPRARAGRSPRR